MQAKLNKQWIKHIFLQLNSIQFHIAFSFSALILVIITIIGFVSYDKFSNTLEENAKEYNLQLTKQVKENVDYYIRYMDDISSIVQNDPSFQQYFSSNENGSFIEKGEQENKLIDLFNSFINARNDIVSIFAFGYNGQILKSNPKLKIKDDIKIENQDWYLAAKESHGEPVVSSSHVQAFVDDPHWVVSLSKELKSTDSHARKGILLIDLNYKIISEICKKVQLGSKGYIFIMDKQGNIVYHPQQQMIYSRLKTEMITQVLNAKGKSFVIDHDGERKLYTITTSHLTGWKVVSVTNVNDMIMDGKKTKKFFMMMIVISLLLSLLIAIVISSRISRPIRKLELSMKEVEMGNFDIELDFSYNHEVGRLSSSFNMMTRKIKELMQQVVEEQKALRKSEIKALQSQINPHFLYNTLDSIIWMAESDQNEEVIDMTSSLAKLFRISLNKGNETVSISGEIEHVKNYLLIQKMRYRNKLDFIIDVDPAIMSYQTIKLILQPLVENAIYHGIKNKTGKGLIRILGKEVEGKVLLQVIDNGVGMDSSKIKNIYSDEYRENSKGNGVGVKNVHERLQIYYGQDFGVSFQSEVNQGTTVSIWIPVVTL
ncbi:cache domain-containing sensor histidine kinase [Neobacillus cucumis]|uniref:histidine kinase n=1 Tax=Neobacillus cucumis TaxID=1740721 RepID=A0A2N5HE29_9BACI|nr:sensor histidine kinase [Neobacillus cucumis]PLS03733.1 C50 carotenoid epsilon cyclase [Neobacillus cucumis]